MNYAMLLETTPTPPHLAGGGLSMAETVEFNAASRTRKAELLAEATRQFCELDRPDAEEIQRFKEFFYQLIDGCDKADRRQISVAIAGKTYVPRPIVFYLAMEDKEVAAPVLLFSPVLNEADILQLAGRLSLDHLQVLCRRNDLTPAAANALLKHGGPPIAAILAKNVHTAGLSVAGLMEQKSKGERQAARHSAAPEQTMPAVEEMASAAPEARTPTESEVGEQNVNDTLLGLAGKGGRLGRSAPSSRLGTVSRMRQHSIPVDHDTDLTERLIRAARSGETSQVAAIIAAEAQCTPAAVTRMLHEPGIEPVSAMLKGIGIDKISASQILLLMKPETCANTDELALAIRAYRKLKGEECRQFLEMLRGIAPQPAASPENGEAFTQAIDARRREVVTPTQRPTPHNGPSRTDRRSFGKAASRR